MRRAVSVLLLLSGCFVIEPSEGYLCREDSADACPAGQVCDVAKRCCHKPGNVCNGPGPVASPDLGVAIDLATTEPFGCAGKGVQIGPGLYGCDGPFARYQASSLCAQGYEIADYSLTAQELDSCQQIKTRFYLSKSLIYHSGMNVTNPVQCNAMFLDTLSCVTPSPVTFRFRLGCGGLRFTGYLECAKYCGVLSQVVSCYQPTPIDCINSDIPGTLNDANSNPGIGVLCRKR